MAGACGAEGEAGSGPTAFKMPYELYDGTDPAWRAIRDCLLGAGWTECGGGICSPTDFEGFLEGDTSSECRGNLESKAGWEDTDGTLKPPDSWVDHDGAGERQLSVRTADIDADAVDCLTSGFGGGAWTGRAGDGEERLYPPEGTEGCKEYSSVSGGSCVDALKDQGWEQIQARPTTKVCPPESWWN